MTTDNKSLGEDMAKVGDLQKSVRFVAIVCMCGIVPEEPVLLLSPAVVQPRVAMVTFLGHVFETWKPMSLHYLLTDISAHPLPLKKEA